MDTQTRKAGNVESIVMTFLEKFTFGPKICIKTKFEREDKIIMTCQ